jgi:glutamate dehydrogenase
MLLSEQQFMAIKERYIEEVLVRLRALARQEAELLLRVNLHDPHEPLYKTSKKLSLAIIRAADAVEAEIDDLPKDAEPLLRQLVIDHLPPVLVREVGDSLWTRIPRSYLKWMMAKSLGARMVYREGYKDIEGMSVDALRNLAIRYLRLEHERNELAAKVAAARNIPESARVAHLLRTAGILSTLGET